MSIPERSDTHGRVSFVGSGAKRTTRIRFAEGTIEPRRHDIIALSISRHQYVAELGYTQYFIQLMYREVEWSLKKRYRDFEELNNNLVAENFESGLDLPQLPKKRWFEKQRWINKHDESYSTNRRTALQQYMRDLVRIPWLRRQSQVLKSFLDFHFIENVECPEEEEAAEQARRLSDAEESRWEAHRAYFHTMEAHGGRVEEVSQSADGEVGVASGHPDHTQQQEEPISRRGDEEVGDEAEEEDEEGVGFRGGRNRVPSSSSSANGDISYPFSGSSSGGGGGGGRCSPGKGGHQQESWEGSDGAASEESEFDYNARQAAQGPPGAYNSHDSDDEPSDTEAEAATGGEQRGLAPEVGTGATPGSSDSLAVGVGAIAVSGDCIGGGGAAEESLSYSPSSSSSSSSSSPISSPTLSPSPEDAPVIITATSTLTPHNEAEEEDEEEGPDQQSAPFDKSSSSSSDDDAVVREDSAVVDSSAVVESSAVESGPACLPPAPADSLPAAVTSTAEGDGMAVAAVESGGEAECSVEEAAAEEELLLQ